MLDPTGIASVVGTGIGWVTNSMELFMDPPAVYFVGFAIIGAAAKVARKFVPMKR